MHLTVNNVVSPLAGLNGLSPSTVVREADRTKEPGAFGDILNAYIGLLNETDAYQAYADQAQVDFVTGKTDDMVGVLLAQEKAYASLNFTVQVVNKVLDAYREIMRVSM